MNFLIDIGHPAHVHLFKLFARIVENKGHCVLFTAKNTATIKELMDGYGLKYILVGRKPNSLFLKILSTVKHTFKILLIVKKEKMDIGIGISGLIPLVSRISGMKAICLDDDDSKITPLYAKSIEGADSILTPEAINHDNRGEQQISYNGYHELAYLHPNHFNPDPDILSKIGVNKDDVFFVLRFNAFRAHHDYNEFGLNNEQKAKLIQLLKPYGKIFISTENESEIYPEHQLKLPAQEIHSVLYYSKMFVGDSQTMTSEAAILGTPALKCNTFAGRLSIPNELEEKYGLCYAYKPDDFNQMLERITELLAHPNLHEEYQSRRQKMLADKIDVTAFMVWFIENYPRSIQIMKEDPDYQYSFK